MFGEGKDFLILGILFVAYGLVKLKQHGGTITTRHKVLAPLWILTWIPLVFMAIDVVAKQVADKQLENGNRT